MKIKTNSGISEFNDDKMKTDIKRAFSASDMEVNDAILNDLIEKVKMDLIVHADLNGVVEKVDALDCIEDALMAKRYYKVARAFMRYRYQHILQKDLSLSKKKRNNLFNKYIDQLDWKINENANMGYSLQGMNNAIVNELTQQFWLDAVVPKEAADAYSSGYIHIHDLGLLGVYCNGWDIQDLLLRGFGGVEGKLHSSPAKHFDVALGQAVNFLYSLQGESSGAVAFSNFDTYLAPFIFYDGLTYKQLKQALQTFVFNMNVPTRVGFQTPFSNITLDLTIPNHLKGQPVIIGGEYQKETYGEFQKEVNLFNKALFEVMIEGDAQNRIFTFPIPTVNITSDFDWDNKNLEILWEGTAKYGLCYFANYCTGDMSPEDSRSMCCRLRLDLKELHKRGGGLFGSSSLTGSVGVVTLNLPMMAYEASGTVDQFFTLIKKYAELGKVTLEAKRKLLENLTEKGLYPYSKHYLANIKKRDGSYWANHFSTIGVIGMSEASEMLGIPYDSDEGKELAERTLKYLNEMLLKFQKDTGNFYNLEATPAEGASYKLARKAKDMHNKILTSGTEEPYFTNSTMLPVTYSDDVFKVLEHQNEIQALYTGGTVLHVYTGQQLSGDQAKALVKKVMHNYKIPYVSLTPTFSICPEHGYISGEHKVCPKCLKDKERLEKKVKKLTEEIG